MIFAPVFRGASASFLWSNSIFRFVFTIVVALPLLGSAEPQPVEPWEVHCLLGNHHESVAKILLPLKDAPAVPDIQIARHLLLHSYGSEALNGYLSDLHPAAIHTGEVAFRVAMACALHDDSLMSQKFESLAFKLLRQELYRHPRFEAVRLLRLHILTSTSVALFHELGPDVYRRESLESGLAAAKRCLEVNDIALALGLLQECTKAYLELKETFPHGYGASIAEALLALRPSYPLYAEQIDHCVRQYREAE